MPFKQSMNWDGSPNFRWRKYYKGTTYRVHCGDLHLPENLWTEEGSRAAANEWWEQKLTEIHAVSKPVLDPLNQKLAAILDGTTPDELRRLADQGAEARRVLAVLEAASIDGKSQPLAAGDGFTPIGTAPMPIAELATLPIPQRIITKNLTDGIFDDDEDVAKERLDKVAKTLAKPKVETTFTLRHHATRFLELELAKNNRPRTYGELSESINAMLSTAYKGSLVLSPEMDVRTLDKTTVENYFLFLRNQSKHVPAQQKKQWSFFKRLVRYIWEAELIDLPKNLDSNSFTFKVTASKVKRYDLQMVRDIFKELPDRSKLYALLSANCGMLTVDMGCLTKNDVDLNAGRIKRKRTKTSEEKDVPEVNYKLWPLTLKLLNKYYSDDDTLALTSKTGTKLWEHWIGDDGKEHEKNLITLQWKRHKPGILLKAFRSIGATIIGDHKEYGRYYSHYLGHSPKSIGDKHYVPPSDDLFDEIMAYMGKELGLA